MSNNPHKQPSLVAFSLLEVIFSLGLLLLFSTAIVFLVLQSLSIERQSAEYLTASSYAAEGMEAIRFVSRSGYNLMGTLSEGDVERHSEEGLRFQYGPGSFGIYERKISVTDLDPTTKQVQVVVSWPITSAVRNSYTLTGYLFDWQQSY